MTLVRMDNILIVVEDLEVASSFFAELGMELEGRTAVEGTWVDRIVGLDGVRSEIAMMRTPDGNGRLELDEFHVPPESRAALMNACLRVCGPTGLLIPARLATRRTIRPAAWRSRRRPSGRVKIGPSKRSPSAGSIARAVRGASGIVTI